MIYCGNSTPIFSVCFSAGFKWINPDWSFPPCCCYSKVCSLVCPDRRGRMGGRWPRFGGSRAQSLEPQSFKASSLQLLYDGCGHSVFHTITFKTSALTISPRGLCHDVSPRGLCLKRQVGRGLLRHTRHVWHTSAMTSMLFRRYS